MTDGSASQSCTPLETIHMVMRLRVSVGRPFIRYCQNYLHDSPVEPVNDVFRLLTVNVRERGRSVTYDLGFDLPVRRS